MSALHVLIGNDSGSFICAVHVPVPASNNPAGISWRTALVNSGLIKPSILKVGTGPGQLLSAEATQLAAGELFEVQIEFRAVLGWSNAQRNAAIDAAIVETNAKTLTMLQTRLRFFGATR